MTCKQIHRPHAADGALIVTCFVAAATWALSPLELIHSMTLISQSLDRIINDIESLINHLVRQYHEWQTHSQFNAIINL